MLFKEEYSRCPIDAKKVVSKEFGNEHILLNNSKIPVYQFHIDGDIERGTEERCDYIVEAEKSTAPQAYIIELKGSDLNKAIGQIERTIQRYYQRLKGYRILPRIVIHRTSTHDIQGKKCRDLRRKYPLTVIKTRKYQETL